MSAAKTDLPASRYFRLEQLGEGVYFAVATPGAGAMGNAGIIDLGGETLVFDTMLTTAAARDLRAAAERLTGRAPHYVVVSHFHADHTIGACVFDSAVIISTTRTAALIPEHNDPMLAMFRERGAELDAQARAEAEAAHDPAVRRDMEEQNEDFAALTHEAPQTRTRLPDLTFESRLTFHGATRQAQLITWGGGHTPSDAVLYLPNERILFAGDLIFYRCHASLNFGDPSEWLRILGEMERLDIDILAPGHGVVASRVAIAEQRAYLETLLSLALQAIEADKTENDVAAMPIPAEFHDYGFASGFTRSMQATLRYQRARMSATDKAESVERAK